LVDLGALKDTFKYSPADAVAMAATIIFTLIAGIELGLIAGISLSIVLHLYRTSKPHVAIIGQVPGTEHFRNIKRHNVITYPGIVSIRIDESLYFPNARFIEDQVNEAVANNSDIHHLILVCSAINSIDGSALESLESINLRLKDGGITFHLSEVKGPVMDQLKRSNFLEELTGKVYFTQFEAISILKNGKGKDNNSLLD